MGEPVRFRTTGDATIAELWIDDSLRGENAWLRANDGTEVVIPCDLRDYVADLVRGRRKLKLPKRRV